MSLKELTKDKHAAAEGTKFMRAVFDQTLPMNLWEDYTYQKHIWYQAIEDSARSAGLLDQLPGIERADLIMEDYEEMVKGQLGAHTYKDVSKNYAEYIKSLTDPVKIMAHLYTWHMGDMFGGQMIKKIIKAPHRHLEFDNVKDLMFTIRGMLDDNMADEANIAFDWAIQILQAYDSRLE
jgi:heme oxygenase